MPAIDVCALEDIEEEDVRRFDRGETTFAVYRMLGEDVYCTDGLCTHEQVHLEEGLVMDHVVECPKHNGRFDIRTGAPLAAPVCVALTTYPARVEAGRVIVDLPE